MKYLLLITLFTQLLLAAPAFQGKRTFTQPDGTLVTYQNRGDEYLHYAESDDGEILLYSKKNARMEYAEIRENSLRPSGKVYNKVKSTKSSKRISKTTLNKLRQERKADRLSKRHQNKVKVKQPNSNTSVK